MIDRRRFLLGLTSLVAAPAVITTPGLLMPVRKIIILPDALYPGEINLEAGRDLAYWVERLALRDIRRLEGALHNQDTQLML